MDRYNKGSLQLISICLYFFRNISLNTERNQHKQRKTDNDQIFRYSKNNINHFECPDVCMQGRLQHGHGVFG